MSNAPTFLLKEIITFPMTVHLAIPPEDPTMKGSIIVDVAVKSRSEVKEMSEKNVPDEEFFRDIVKGVRGLGDVNGNLLNPEDGVKEVLTGRFSMYMVPAIIKQYYEQYGEARQKNSEKPQKR